MQHSTNITSIIYNYNTYKYLYPPRPENKITPESISRYDDGRYFAQPKYNGSAAVIFFDGKGGVKIMNRHNESFHISKLKFDAIDFNFLQRGEGYLVLCGELLNLNKRNENGKYFNQKFIIWDILVYNGKYLINSTFESRLKLLDKLYPEKEKKYNSLINIGSDSVFRAQVYTKNFKNVYDELVKTDLYEGLVMKRKDAKLEFGFREKNNTSWQVKARKSTKNYRY